MTYNEQETTWNELQRPETITKMNKKQPKMTYSEQETTWNNPQRIRHYLQGPEPTNKQKKIYETTTNNPNLRLFYNVGQSVLFSNMFSTQLLIAIIWALLHRESWWK